MPAKRRNAPTMRPAAVTGYWSPYPTVVIVTRPHQTASPALTMFAPGAERSA